MPRQPLVSAGFATLAAMPERFFICRGARRWPFARRYSPRRDGAPPRLAPPRRRYAGDGH